MDFIGWVSSRIMGTILDNCPRKPRTADYVLAITLLLPVWIVVGALVGNKATPPDYGRPKQAIGGVNSVQDYLTQVTDE